MSTMTPVPKGHPLMVAWEAYKATESYENTKRWAVKEEHTEGSLWAAFEHGWRAAHERSREGLNNFDVMKAMTEANDSGVELAPITNIIGARKTKRGVVIEIGWGNADILPRLAQGRVCGGLIIMEKSAFDAAKRRLEAKGGTT